MRLRCRTDTPLSIVAALNAILSRKIIVYLFVGGSATLLHLSILIAIKTLLGVQIASVPNLVASTFAMGYTFILNKKLVFNDGGDYLRSPLKHLVLYAFVGFIHFSFPLVLSDYYGLHYLIPFVLGLTLHVPLAYWLSKNWVFK